MSRKTKTKEIEASSSKVISLWRSKTFYFVDELIRTVLKKIQMTKARVKKVVNFPKFLEVRNC